MRYNRLRRPVPSKIGEDIVDFDTKFKYNILPADNFHFSKLQGQFVLLDTYNTVIKLDKGMIKLIDNTAFEKD